MAAETLKLLLVALQMASSIAASGEGAVMSLLLPLLIETIAPEAEPTPALVEMSAKVIAGLAAGPHAHVFRSAVLELPADAKQRLQV